MEISYDRNSTKILLLNQMYLDEEKYIQEIKRKIQENKPSFFKQES